MKKCSSVFLFAVLITLFLAIVSVGQSPSSSVAQTAPSVDQKTQNVTLWSMWVTGGWAMWPIGALSIGMLALIVFGFLNTKESKMIHVELIPDIQKSIRNLDFYSASAICSGTPSVMTNIINAGLDRFKEGVLDMESVEKAMEEAAVEENTNGLRLINYLSIIATTAPMFGLLGTVSGMIKAFQKIGFGGMGDPEKLAGDIGEAMITTGFGLIVGIPAMFFYFHIKGNFVSNMARIGRAIGSVIHEIALIARRIESGEVRIETEPPRETNKQHPSQGR